MNESTYTAFREFLGWQENRRNKYLLGFQLYWYQRFYIRLLNRWWSKQRIKYPHIKPGVLWESICKGRF